MNKNWEMTSRLPSGTHETHLSQTMLHFDFSQDDAIVRLHVAMERAGCSIQQWNAKWWLSGRQFSECRGSSRSNWVLYCNIWLQSNSRGPGDVLLDRGGALFLQISQESGLNYQSYLVVSCSETLHNKLLSQNPPWDVTLGRSEESHCFVSQREDCFHW